MSLTILNEQPHLEKKDFSVNLSRIKKSKLKTQDLQFECKVQETD